MELFNEQTINLVPVYTNETEKSQRKKAQEEELKKLKEKLKEKRSKKKTGETKKVTDKIINEEKIWLPKRIP